MFLDVIATDHDMLSLNCDCHYGISVALVTLDHHRKVLREHSTNWM